MRTKPQVIISRTSPTKNGQDNSKQAIIDLLQERIEEQKKEIDVKNNQIATLQEQLTNSQKLLAMEKQEKQLLLESGNARDKPKKSMVEKFFDIFKKNNNESEM